MGQHLVTIIKLHTEHSPGKNGRNNTFEFDSIFCAVIIVIIVIITFLIIYAASTSPL